MNITAQLDQLSAAEKLRTMEYLWDDLCRHADVVTSPTWHKDVLAQREQMLADRSAAFRDWETEKSITLDTLTQEASCN